MFDLLITLWVLSCTLPLSVLLLSQAYESLGNAFEAYPKSWYQSVLWALLGALLVLLGASGVAASVVLIPSIQI